MKTMPIPQASLADQNSVAAFARQLHDAKAEWDTANKICTRFARPWVLQLPVNGDVASVNAALDNVLERESELDAELALNYDRLNDSV